jgi:histidinol dehydrogenase
LWTDSLEEAIAFSNSYAPEHLLLVLAEPDAVLARLRNAGTIFVGAHTSVAFGDYMTGANHVLPTGGLARSYSGLSTLDFVRWTTYQRVTRDAAARLADDVGIFADAEGLGGHALAARAWRAKVST